MKILICDDHPVFRDGLRLLLEELGHEVVAEAATGEEALEAARTLEPDVVVMDLHLPGISGVEATQALIAARPELGVLILTMLDDDSTLLASLRAGARGYLLKGADHTEVERALFAVAGGDVVVSGRAAGLLRAGLDHARPSSAFPQLSPRELEVLDLVSRGRSNEQIAASLFLSIKTVRNNVSSILTKLDVNSRAEAVARARDADVGRPAD